jgi:hypothetical protein
MIKVSIRHNDGKKKRLSTQVSTRISRNCKVPKNFFSWIEHK